MPAGAQDELRDGFTKFYYPNNQVSSEGFIREGKPDGYWKTYYVTGIPKSEGLRTNFQLDSTWTFYSQTGEVEERIDYKYGKRNGYTLKYSVVAFGKPVLISKELYVNDSKEGIAYYYFPDGNLKEEISFVSGRKQGFGREYDEKGKLITILEYHNNYIISRQRVNRIDAQGRKQGLWINIYPSGKINKEMTYVDDQLNGIYKEYNENGNLVLSLKYLDGKIVEDKEKFTAQDNIDFRRQVNEKGVLVSTGSYLNEKPVGIHRLYNEQGKVSGAKIYNDSGFTVSEGIVDETGSKEGDWKDFYSTGELRATGAYRNNQQSGKWNFYYKNGKKEQEGSYLRGLYDGIWTWYYDNGNIWREETYFNGKEDGLATEYDEIGNIITKGEYINGEKEGLWFYKVNDHTEEGNYQTGLRSGVWKYYYEDGTLQFEGKFEQDQPHGKHKYYYPSGVLSEERYYVRGVREKNWKKYDELGNLQMTITYNRDQEYRINGVKIDLPKGSIQTIN
jgi:antitoxin component YwqK of YwqJK toxin-antitoxin module